MNNRKEQQGYIALITTLVVGAVAVVFTTSMLSMGVVSSQTSLVYEDGAAARSLAEACAEYALQQIRNSNSFAGSDTLVFDGGSCDYSVINNGGQSRTLIAEGSVDNAVKGITIEVDSLNPVINVLSWE